MYINRDIENTLLEASKSFQVITIYGSRQVGKTTTVDYLFGNEFSFVSLDDGEELELALTNPRVFMEAHPWPLIIDEVQKAVGLLNEIKKIVDTQRRDWMKTNEPRRLMYVLTGSNQFELQEGISESLAGRTAVINMSGLTQVEKGGGRGEPFMVDFAAAIQRQKDNPCHYKGVDSIFDDIFQGVMPDVITGASKRDIYYKSYIETYIEKDIRRLISVSGEMQFRKFITLLAYRTAQEIKYSELSNALGINVETCKRWISILQTSGIVFLLEPYMANVSKRIIKAPKLYFMDTGLCAYMCKWPDAVMLKECAMSGAFFETYVVSEIIKSFYNCGTDPRQLLYYYRDIDKKEVDIILVKEGALYPVEIKKSVAPSRPTKNFKVLDKYKMPVKQGMIIDTTDKVRALNDNAFIYPVTLLGF